MSLQHLSRRLAAASARPLGRLFAATLVVALLALRVPLVATHAHEGGVDPHEHVALQLEASIVTHADPGSEPDTGTDADVQHAHDACGASPALAVAWAGVPLTLAAADAWRPGLFDPLPGGSLVPANRPPIG